MNIRLPLLPLRLSLRMSDFLLLAPVEMLVLINKVVLLMFGLNFRPRFFAGKLLVVAIVFAMLV